MASLAHCHGLAALPEMYPERRQTCRKCREWSSGKRIGCVSQQEGFHKLKLCRPFDDRQWRVGREKRLLTQAQAEAQISTPPPPPPIDGDLLEVMCEYGAEVCDATGEVLSFGDDSEALTAAYAGSAVFDMSHFGRIRVTGDDRLRFLHNQSTADFQSRKPGEGLETVFVTNTARTIDLATAWIMETAVILTVSPSKRLDIAAMLEKYIFFADKVTVADISEQTCHLALIGPKCDEALLKLGLGGLIGKPEGTHSHFNFQGSPVTVAVGSGLASPGFQLLLAPEVAAAVWTALVSTGGAVPMGTRVWEALRVRQGRPAPAKELTDEVNPLEAGLWKAISTTKGCYIGQETIARLITYDGVKQQLRGFLLDGWADPGTPIIMGGSKVGKLTSCVELGPSPPGKEQLILSNEEGNLMPGATHIGLGYVKRVKQQKPATSDAKEAVEASVLEVAQGEDSAAAEADIGGVRARLVDSLPYLQHSLVGKA
eukprot:TRINITY_DN6670_c0_g1_i4.p1 TRINITY_DN6670_c0_g1~~TRINITY_DN6670_c0_g1_i4.p1  ORF type:complete len:485 (-),score=66.43 TRINITY_DN6670_c0_g1_i4:343-1797(-)